MMLCEAQAAADKQKQGNAVQAGRRRKREVRTKPKQVAASHQAAWQVAPRVRQEQRGRGVHMGFSLCRAIKTEGASSVTRCDHGLSLKASSLAAVTKKSRTPVLRN